MFITAVNDAATAVQRINVTEMAVSTTVQGFVQFDDGSPAAGAMVETNFGGAGLINADGSFEIDLDQVPSDSAISVSATFEDMGRRFVGGSDPADIVPGGVSDAGLITLHPLGVGPLFPGQNFAAGNQPLSVSLGDLDADGRVDAAEAAAFIDLFTGGDPRADLNGDGVLDLADITRAFDSRQQEPGRIAE